MDRHTRFLERNPFLRCHYTNLLKSKTISIKIPAVFFSATEKKILNSYGKSRLARKTLKKESKEGDHDS